jgi:hypothetical protein
MKKLTKELIVKKRFLLPLLALGLTATVQANAQSQAQTTSTEILTGELALNHTLGIDIPPNSIQTRIGKEGLDDLYNRFEQHYGEFVRKDNPRKVDFDFIFGAKNAQTTMELTYLIELAMQEGLPIERFERFGIKSLGDQSYDYNLKQSPHLALPRNLFTTLSSASDIKVHASDLLKKGFRQVDLSILKKYLKKNNNKSESDSDTLAYITYLSDNIEFFESIVQKKQILSPGYYQHNLKKLSYIRSYIGFNSKRNWALTLLSQLDSQRQRILKSYLIETMSNQISITATPSDSGNAAFEKLVESGQFSEDITNYLGKQHNGEKF